MSIAIVILMVVALLSIGVKMYRKRQTGSFFWWSGKDGSKTKRRSRHGMLLLVQWAGDDRR